MIKDASTLSAIWFDESYTLIEMWLHINRCHSDWVVFSMSGKIQEDHEWLERRDAHLISKIKLSESKTWSALCAAAGWTVYGAVALSWCKDAKLEDVWAGWLESGFPLKPLLEFERPARFLNPALLPQTRKVSEINQWVLGQKPANSDAYQLAFCACLVALKEPPEFDLSPAKYEGAMPQIAAFLKSRLLKKPNRTAEDNAIIELWSETIKNTEWDIWTEAD